MQLTRSSVTAAAVLAALAAPAFAQPASTRPAARETTADAPAAAARAPRAFQPNDWHKVKQLASPALSPDGRLVAVTVTTVNERENKRHSEVWVVPTAGGEAVRYTAPGFESSNPRFSPDGKYLLFTSNRPGGRGNTWALRMDAPGGEAFQPEDALPEGSMPRDRRFVVWSDAAPADSAARGDSTARSADPFARKEMALLYLAIAVTKPELIFRDPAAAPLELDNEPEDMHSDGVQVYLRPGTEIQGIIAVPLADGTVAIRGVTEESKELDATGRWSPTEDGYLLTLRLAHPDLSLQPPGARIGFELVVNEMQPDRLRRAGQLAWSGGGGWVYLRGDRIHHSELGLLELA